MTGITEEATLERHLPGIWGILHAVPGLVAMIAVSTMAIVATQGSASGVSKPAALQAPIIEPVPAEVAAPRSISIVSEPPALPVLAIYLVRTQGQAYEADWQENFGALEVDNSGFAWPNRTHKVLIAGTEDEVRAAGQIVLEQMLLPGRIGLVEVIDLRELEK